MKTKSPVFRFLPVVFALACLTGCETTKTNISTQDDHGRTVTVSTFAGGGNRNYDDGGTSPASPVQFDEPYDVAIDRAGNLYVADRDKHLIRKITPTGEVSTLAGSGYGYADGFGEASKFSRPRGIAIDTAGNLYVADTRNYRIRKVTPKGEVSTLAGSTEGFADGPGISAKFNEPSGIAIDAVGNLYVADRDNHRIRKVTPKGEVSTLAGSTQGFADGPGISAQFYSPSGIAVDSAGNLYVADSGNHRIRKLTSKGEVSTLAGSVSGRADGPGISAQFNEPSGIAVDRAGNLYVADSGNSRIRKITPKGEVSTLAGSASGHADGTGCAVQFSRPRGVAIDAAGNLYVADAGNDRIRKIVFGQESKERGKTTTVSILAGSVGGNHGNSNGVGGAARFDEPSGIAIDVAGNLYVADYDNNIIRKVTPQGEVSTLAGNGSRGNADGIGNNAQFAGPYGITIDAAGNLYVADHDGHRIRKVTSKGEVSTLAGGIPGLADGIGNAAQFHGPRGIAIDAAGNLYVADFGSHRIRKITPNGEVSTLAGNGISGHADDTGSNAQFDEPYDIAIDAAGNLYVADLDNYRIRKITPKGEVSTLAGSARGFADGVGSAAQFSRPRGIAIDATGNLYVTDGGRVRKVTPKGEVSTLPGRTDGDGCAEQSGEYHGIAIDAAGTLYVVDKGNHRINKIVFE